MIDVDPHITVLSPEEKRQFEAAVARFEQTWHESGPPALADFLPPGGSLRAALLAELVHIDREFRQARGQEHPWEDYLRQFPELGSTLADRDAACEATLARSPDSTASVAATLALPPKPAAPAMPEIFGRYRIRQELGRGAMGAVYLAHDTQLDRDVALKIPKFKQEETAELLERFYREARAAAMLRHPNLCPVYDVGEIDGQHYITMAFIQGRPLRDFTRSRKVQPQRQAAAVVRRIALGLAEAHAHGVIHRDLKPANVMIDAKGEPVVMDFGLARRASAQESQATQSGVILGTPAYMSPEQVAGDPKKIGPAADIYSLGVILYELLAGKLPFAGDLMATLMQIASQEPAPPSQFRKDLDPRLEAICLKMMAKRSDDRYGSMGEVAQALGDYLKTAKQPAADAAPVGGDDVYATTPLAPASPADTATDVPTVDATSPVLRSIAGSKSTAATPARQGSPKKQRLASQRATLIGAGLAALAVLGAVTLFLRLGKVDVQVVIDDPSLAIRIAGETVTFETSSEPIRLKPGDHQFIVQRGDLEIETDRFTVKKEGKNILQVSIVEGEVVVSQGSATPRAVATAPPRVPRDPQGWRGWPADAPPPAIVPFDAAQAKQHQEAWAAYLGAPVEYTNSLGMKFRLIPPGEYLRGSTPAEIEEELNLLPDYGKFFAKVAESEGPQHRTVLTKPFYLGVHEVTQEDYFRVTETNPSTVAAASHDPHFASRVQGLDTARLPVETISWFDAVDFCIQLSQRETLAIAYRREGQFLTALSGNGYRLPTDAEWEFACRAGTTTRFWSGDAEADLLRVDWVQRNSANLRPRDVGLLPANPFGLHDLHGNVGEWVEDAYRETGYQEFAAQPAIDPRAANQGERSHLYRGGYWNSWPPSRARSARHNSSPNQSKSVLIGMRLVLSLDAVRGLQSPRNATNVRDAGPAAPPPAIAPFNAAQAKQHQDAWAAYLGTPVESTNSIGMKLRLIPPGEFLMGSAAGDPNEAPVHAVTITRPYYIGVYETTQDEYEAIMGENPGKFSGKRLPVESVSSEEAINFCRRISEREGGTYRLPTEAEWEFACRSGTLTAWSFGDDPARLDEYAWCKENGENKSHPVGEKKPNAFGLYDVHGNVFEYCTDYTAPYSAEPAVDPTGPPLGSYRGFRGGSWSFPRFDSRSADRQDKQWLARGTHVGFRVVREINAAARASEPPPSAEPPKASSSPSANDTPKASGAPSAASAPFDAAQAKQHQETWAAYLGIPVESMNSIGMEFRLIPPGAFLMGSTEEQIARAVEAVQRTQMLNEYKERYISEFRIGERPQHGVRLTRPFLLGATEVTIGQFRRFVDATSYVTHAERALAENQEVHTRATWQNPEYSVTDDSPVTCLTWDEAVAFANWLSEQEQRTPCYRRDADGGWEITAHADGYRLPTEAEWEYACRAGATTQYSFGDDAAQLGLVAWSLENSGQKAHKVGATPANPFGLHDMHGNVWEWCQDWFGDTWYAISPPTDPQGPIAGSGRVLRGGAWNSPAVVQRSANRLHLPAWNKSYHNIFGFRLARAIEPAPAHRDRQVATTDPDRAAAEWVLARDGTVMIAAGGKELSIGPAGTVLSTVAGAGSPASSRRDLPTNPFRLLGVAYKDQVVTAVDLDRLQGAFLQHLIFHNASLTDAGLAAIAAQAGVRRLFLIQNSRITNAGVEQLRKLPRLETLTLTSAAIDDAGLVHLGQIKSLKTLSLEEMPITDRGVAALGELPELEYLRLHRCRVAGECASHLKSNKKLKVLVITGPGALTRPGLTAVAALDTLESLYLGNGSPLRGDWLSELAGHASLKTLSLTATAVGDEALVHLQAIPHLETVNVAGARFTAAGLAELKSAKPNLQIIGAPSSAAPP